MIRSHWSAENNSKDNIAVNQSVDMTITITAPDDAWAGTTVAVTLNLYSDELYVSNVTFLLTVQQISGWKLNLSDTNLIIHPDGQNLTLNVEHLGNLARQPWFSKGRRGMEYISSPKWQRGRTLW